MRLHSEAVVACACVACKRAMTTQLLVIQRAPNKQNRGKSHQFLNIATSEKNGSPVGAKIRSIALALRLMPEAETKHVSLVVSKVSLDSDDVGKPCIPQDGWEVHRTGSSRDCRG